MKNASLYFFIFALFYGVLIYFKSLHAEPLGPDDARHVLTGIFYRDLLLDLPVSDLRAYAFDFYIQYPALGLLHWPPVFHLLQAFAFLIFGVHDEVSRLLVYALAVTGAFYVYRMGLLFDLSRGWALFSGVMCLSFPIYFHSSQKVMLEIPSLSFCILALYYFCLHLKSGKISALYCSGLLSVVAILTKGFSLFILPILAALAFRKYGWKLFRQWHMLIIAVVASAVLITYNLIVAQFTGVRSLDLFTEYRFFYTQVCYTFMFGNFGWVAMLLGPAGIVLMFYRKEWLFAILVGLGLFLCFTMVGIIRFPLERYLTYPAPFIALGLGYLGMRLQAWNTTVAGITGLAIIAYYSVLLTLFQMPIVKGYEEVVKYILENRKGASVLMHSRHAANLALYMRIFGKDEKYYVLPGTKYLAYEQTNELAANALESPEEVFKLLVDYGVKYLVIEDKERHYKATESYYWLREYLEEEKEFKLVKRFDAIDTEYPDFHLLLYEFSGDGKLKVEEFNLNMGRLKSQSVSVPLH